MADALARRGGAERVVFTKVLGHAKEIVVLQGRTTRQNKWGNDKADKLAVEGALEHAAPEQLLKDLKRNRERAQQGQQMMLDISDAVLGKEGTQGDGAQPPQHPGGHGKTGNGADGPGGKQDPDPYPWGWNPEGTHVQMEVPTMAPPPRSHGAKFIWGPRL